MRSMHMGLFIYRLHFWLQIAMPCVKKTAAAFTPENYPTLCVRCRGFSWDVEIQQPRFAAGLFSVAKTP